MLQKLTNKQLWHEKKFIARERCFAALEVSFDGVAIIGQKGGLEYVNGALLQMLGIDQTNLKDHLDQSWRDLFKNIPSHQSLDKIASALKSKDEEVIKFSITSEFENEHQRSLSLSVKVLEDKSAILSVQDMTENQKAQTEKAELQEQFYQSQKMEAIGRLAGGMSHDFNNILAAINGYAEFLIQDLEEGSPTQKFAHNILEAGLRARGLVDQMLAFSRREDSSRETIDLTRALKDTVSMLQASLPKTIEVEQHINTSTARIRGNAGQITQILMNLCVNAGDAMEEERGLLSLSIEEENFENFSNPELFRKNLSSSKDIAPMAFTELSASRTVLSLGTIAKGTPYYGLSIKDTGCGMSRIIMEHIFEPFFTTKPVEKGTGLGLAMVHGAITSHQACMIIDSTLGEGTEFKLYFPVDFSDTEEAPTSSIPDDARDKEAIEECMILLVEDQDEVRDMTLKMLSRMGMEAEGAENGIEAMNILRENPDAFDLVITDHNMPHMTGLELTQYAGVEFPHIPFIMLSGYSKKELSALMQEQKNIKASLRKPISLDDLQGHVMAVLSNAESQD